MRGSRTKSGDRSDVVMAVEHSTGIVLDAGEAPAGGSEKLVARAMIRRLAKGPQIAAFTGDAPYADGQFARAVEKSGKHCAFKLKGATSPACSRTRSSASRTRTRPSPTGQAPWRRGTAASRGAAS